MTKTRVLLSLVIGLLTACASTSHSSAKDVEVFVAPQGNDASPGSRRAPKATLRAAMDAVRLARQSQDVAATIYLRGGHYTLSQPVELTPKDSGLSAEHPLRITAWKNEKPVLSGGQRLTGWKKAADKDGLWTLDLPEVRAGQWYFRQLFVKGERAIRARTPNAGFYHIQGESPKDQPIQLKFKPGDIKKEWAESGDVEVVAFLAWGDIHMQIRAVDETKHVATLSGNPQPSNRENDAQYYVENTPDALDMPGEWYLDRKTGTLSYQANPGVDPNEVEIIAPRLTELVRLQGDLKTQEAVRHVVFDRLVFAHTDWTLARDGYADVQAAVAIHGDFFAEGATDCVIRSCQFAHMGGYAIELGRGCQRFQIVGNEIADIAAGGLRVGVTDASTDAFLANHHHEITDNHIHHLGEVFKPAVGVFVMQSGQNHIAHNHIHDLYYTAISLGWNWGYQETPCRENIVEFNHLHDIGKAVLSDMGAIYTLGIQKGTIIRNNVIHDVASYTYGGWGIYPDEGSTDILIENNVVYRTKSAGFHQHYGRENIVRNNIFAFGKENQIMRSREEEHISFLFTNNIVYYDSGNLLGSNWSNNHFKMDDNLYWDARPGVTEETMKFSGASLADWRKRGHDVHSVIADPMFENPGQYDFRLKNGSPALKMGFKPIDTSKVGVRQQKR